ncbi:MAG: ADP-ribosylglycohydrolase family protein [Desulfococcaceae bacterium]
MIRSSTAVVPGSVHRPETVDGPDRAAGALYGLYVGDALAMPVHWIYDRAKLVEQYGRVTDYMAPRPDHPDSILWRSHYEAPNEKGEILHDQAPYWGRKNVHYHRFLQPGENTLNLQLCSLLIESLNDRGGYDADDWLSRYIDFMTTPGNHRDTYVEEYHRAFFTRYAQGYPPKKCGIPEKHISGLIGLVPILVFHRDRPDRAREAALEHMKLTHRGEKMERAARFLFDILLPVLGGDDLRGTLEAAIDRQDNPYYGHSFRKWLDQPDEWIVGARVSSACYVPESVPAVIYLALKYHDRPEEGLIANTNLGGENAARGAVLGALLGAGNGLGGLPERWVTGLKTPPPELRSI